MRFKRWDRLRGLYRERESVRWSVWILLSLIVVDAVMTWVYFYSPIPQGWKDMIFWQTMFTIAITNYQALIVAMGYAYRAEPSAVKVEKFSTWIGAVLMILEEEGHTPEETADKVRGVMRWLDQYGKMPETAQKQIDSVVSRLAALSDTEWERVSRRVGILAHEGINYLENMAHMSDDEWEALMRSRVRRGLK